MTDQTETTRSALSVRRICDRLVMTATEAMVAEGASISMALDRLLTYAAAQAVRLDGSEATATHFRLFADTIEGGMFAHLESGAAGPRQARH